MGKGEKVICKRSHRFFLCESNLAAPVGSLNVFLSCQQWQRRIECDVFVLVKGITRSIKTFADCNFIATVSFIRLSILIFSSDFL